MIFEDWELESIEKALITQLNITVDFLMIV